MKRISLVAAALCAAAVSGASASALAAPEPEAQAGAIVAPQPDSVGRRIVGTWLATYDGGVHIGFMQWHADGTLVNSMDFAPKIGNVLIGDWKLNGDKSLSVQVTGWTYDSKGATRTGRFVKTETDTLSGDSYSGTFEVIYYDLSDNVVFDHAGTLTASRAVTP